MISRGAGDEMGQGSVGRGVGRCRRLVMEHALRFSQSSWVSDGDERRLWAGTGERLGQGSGL